VCKTFHRSTHKITELTPGKRVVWHTTEASINFVKDKSEWTGTDIVFDIKRKGGKTELHFTHIGLVPTIECYGGCSGAWQSLITEGLYDLITTDKYKHVALEEPTRTAGARRLKAAT
jgi:regulatory protein YycH of two-component signal transduction system YycFG